MSDNNMDELWRLMEEEENPAVLLHGGLEDDDFHFPVSEGTENILCGDPLDVSTCKDMKTVASNC